jgi:hypothetical protein
MTVDSMVSGSFAANSKAQALIAPEELPRFLSLSQQKPTGFCTASECAFIALNDD